MQERELDADPIQVGALIDSLASRQNGLWPVHLWPRLEFDRLLGVGVKGGDDPFGTIIQAAMMYDCKS